MYAILPRLVKHVNVKREVVLVKPKWTIWVARYEKQHVMDDEY